MNLPNKSLVVCPKTGKIIENKPPSRLSRWLWPVTGLAALAWFGLRVVPKPSRANYPCQRLAAPLAFSFLTWLISLAASWAIFRQAKSAWRRARYPLASLSIIAGLAALALGSLGQPVQPVGAALHVDPSNTPVGSRTGRISGARRLGL